MLKTCTPGLRLVLFCRESYGTTSENGDSGGKRACDNFNNGLSRHIQETHTNRESIYKEGNYDEIF